MASKNLSVSDLEFLPSSNFSLYSYSNFDLSSYLPFDMMENFYLM